MACPATDVAVGDAATKGATDVAAGGLADAGAADALGAGAGADAALAGGEAEAALGGGAAADALPTVDVTASSLAPAAAADALPTVDVTASSLAPAAAAGGGGGGGSGLAAAGLGAALGAGGGGPAFLPATNDASALSLSPQLTNSLGVQLGSDAMPAADVGGGGLASPAIDTGGAGTAAGGDAGDPFLGAMTDPTAGESALDAGSGASGGGTNSLTSWLTNPKNAGTLGLLGISGLNALRQPKLPAAGQQAANTSAAETNSALPVVQSGGTATPEWTQQKSTIDASINQQITQQTEAIMQAAANAGEGDPKNSMVVQQQIQTMKQQAETQRQALYLQAQQQNVTNAISELSGGNQVLGGIAGMQLQQTEEAQQAAAQTAELALLLQTMSG